jgi:hypothetical protein
MNCTPLGTKNCWQLSGLHDVHLITSVKVRHTTYRRTYLLHWPFCFLFFFGKILRAHVRQSVPSSFAMRGGAHAPRDASGHKLLALCAVFFTAKRRDAVTTCVLNTFN